MVCNTVKLTLADYIGVAVDLQVVGGNYAVIQKAIKQTVANDTTLERVPVEDCPVAHLHTLSLALLDVVGAVPSTQRATTATALLEKIRKRQRLLAQRGYDRKWREKEKKRKAGERATEEEQRKREDEEKRVLERAQREREAREKLEMRRKLDEALAANQKLLRNTEACEREREAAEQRAKKERERCECELSALREQFRSLVAEKTEGALRRATKRACNDIQEAPSKPPLTPLDFRDEVDFSDPKIAERKSSIHGRGAFSKHGAVKKEVLIEVVLPSEAIGKGFKYNCYKHIKHRDGGGVMYIDPASRMRGTFGACREDFSWKMLRLLNHKNKPNVEFDAEEAARPEWYEAVGKEYKLWYRCTFFATRKIKEGEELTFQYATPPKGAV